jgi:hypothetical protein
MERTGLSNRAVLAMVSSLALSVGAMACAVIGVPPYLAAVKAQSALVRSGGPIHQVDTPPVLQLGISCGLLALVLVLVQQWRRRQYGWMAASLLLSYIGIGSYAVATLGRHFIDGRRSPS